MERRDFLRYSGKTGSAAAAGVAAGAAGALGTTLAAPALAQERVEWAAVSAFDKSGLLGRALENFAAFVETASDGQMVIDVYHAGELVQPFEAVDAVQSGTAQMGFGAPYYWAGKSDSISFVAAMPYGLTAQEQNAWLYFGDGIAMADQHAYNPLGLKFLPLGNTGNQMGGWYAKEIKTVADLNGLKFRMPGLGGEILKTFGVNVVLLPGSEVLPALSSGAIDGTEWIGPAADLGKGLFKVVDYYYYPGWHEPATVLDGFFDLQAWEDLPENLKEIVTRGAESTNAAILSEFQAVNNDALSKLKTEHSVQLRPYSDELIEAIGTKAAEVLPEIASRTDDSRALFNHLIDFRKSMIDWSALSEGAFMQARVAATFETV